MGKISLLFHSLVLAICSIVSIIAGYCVYKVSNLNHQVFFQSIFALAFNILLFAVWCRINNLYFKRLGLNLLSVKSILAVSLLGLFWSPVIFVPVHFISQGYLTDFGNILGIWLYQTTACVILSTGTFILSKTETVKA